MVTQQPTQDFGFGSVVAEHSARRLLNRDGSFNVARRGSTAFGALNVYHALMTMSWPRFLGLSAIIYFAINALFAIAYLTGGVASLQGPSDHHTTGFLRAFFFSVETFGTLGYGDIVPASITANWLVTFESLCQQLTFALGTGVVFARFSRPTARIVYSRRALIAPYQGITAFEFRIVNARSNQIVDLSATVLLARTETVNGKSTRQFHRLSLERESVVFFPLAWTIVHPIDDKSPLLGLTERELKASNAEFLILLRGFDETFSQAVHSRTSFTAAEVEWGARFGSMFNETTNDGVLTIDVRKIHRSEPVLPA
ncbi:MAG: ion channel [Gemmatimonadaceae bacterium]